MSDKEKINYFTKRPPFINRVAEKKYLLEYFNGAPTNILFVYGPKSTGKTALITKIINLELDNSKFDINFINLRMVLMNNFQDFKNLFFPLDLMGKSKKKLKGLKLDGKVNIPLLGEFGYEWKSEDENMMKSNLFGLMEKKLRELNANGIKPVIILDEFQYLKNIIIDEKNNLLLVEELFKFLFE
ncbi:MAG: ATP-binding protein [Candidatus Gracilibacteria bacterium]|nr:ATP-binding protein [Candidatus Gracilibacteria bacterium]